jgi:hypothetical protein
MGASPACKVPALSGNIHGISHVPVFGSCLLTHGNLFADRDKLVEIFCPVCEQDQGSTSPFKLANSLDNEWIQYKVKSVINTPRRKQKESHFRVEDE